MKFLRVVGAQKSCTTFAIARPNLTFLKQRASIEPAAAPAVTYDPGTVAAIIKDLVAIEKPRSLVDKAKSFLLFTTEVRAAMEDDVCEAADETENATAATRENSANAVTSSTPK